jgi:site-specific DNA-adenine methylase
VTVKVPFGALNNTIAKTIALNSPKYTKIVEPFGDGGSFALYIAKKPAKEHIVNVVDEILFNAFVFAKSYTSSQFSQLKKMDWIGSQETFDQVMSINDVEGINAFYKFLYLKKFGMKMGEEEMTFDVFSTGKDMRSILYGLPMMKALLKKVTFQNDDPMNLISSGSFLILVPPNDQIENVKSKISGLSGDFFFAGKEKDDEAVIQEAESYPNLFVSKLSVASIMMNKYSVITNYESKLPAIDPDEMEMNM